MRTPECYISYSNNKGTLKRCIISCRIKTLRHYTLSFDRMGTLKRPIVLRRAKLREVKKSKGFTVPLLCLIIGIMLSCFGCTEVPPKASEFKCSDPVHRCIFYDEKDFLKDINSPKTEPTRQIIRGGVVPHHLVAGYMIADFFNLLADQDVKRIVLLGPNHYRRGPKITSSRRDWQTAFGIQKVDTDLVDVFMDSGMAGLGEEVMALEHSIAGLIPYIKYYLPGITVAPFIFYPDFTLRDMDNFTELLLQNVGEEDVIVASVDFSHYLKLEDANERDQVTLEGIKRMDYAHILQMDDQYLDSPSSIITLLKVMDELGCVNMRVLHHSNSALVLKKGVTETTGYFTIIYN